VNDAGVPAPDRITEDGSLGEPSPAWPYVLVALGVLGVAMAAWRPVPAGVWHDDGVYMLVGKAIAGGHGLTYDGVVGSPPAVKFPPLYPALLGLLWFALGRIGAVTLAASMLNLAFVAVAAALFAKALSDTTGLSKRVCAVVAGLGFVSSDVLRTALVPLSESLFMLLTASALALWSSAAKEEGARARLWLGAILVAAVATRSAGLALVLGFAMAFLTRQRFARAVIVTGPALAFTAAWTWWSGARSADIPEGTRDLLGPYGIWLVDQTTSAPSAFLAALPTHALGVFERIATIAAPGLNGWWLLAAAVPGAVLAVVGLGRAARRFPPLAWLAPAYVCMLLLWPYLDRRLVSPLHPVTLALVAMGAATVFEARRERWLRIPLIALAVAWVSTYSVVTAARIANDWPVGAYRLRAERLAAAVEALSRTAPADAVVGAPEYWAALHLHGGWTVAPSVRFDPRSVDPEAPTWGTADEQISLWRSAGIDHLLLEQAGMLHGAALDQLEEECPGTVFVLARSPPLLVVRIDWDTPCARGGS
jgi:hypothetical protein